MDALQGIDPIRCILTIVEVKEKKHCFFCKAIRPMVVVQISNTRYFKCKKCGAIRGE
jgi:hypothetical protein